MMDDISKQINAGEVSGDDIKAGTSMPHNMFLFNNAIYLLPYTGVGSGITRALDEDVNVTFMNNDKAQEFVITVWREESNQVEDHNTGLRHSDTDLDTDHDTFAEDHDTGLRHSDTDLDTDHDTFAEDHDTIHSYHDTKRVPLTNKQKDIVNFCSVPRTSREILEISYKKYSQIHHIPCCSRVFADD